MSAVIGLEDLLMFGEQRVVGGSPVKKIYSKPLFSLTGSLRSSATPPQPIGSDIAQG